ncbi:MAG: alkyl hydroperoxide reductase [Phycisphaerales bacterium]|nr:alkyl hydroperoxide reductase [Phycisphaerales bacterium]
MTEFENRPSAWMRRWLLAAGVYNLVWGIPIILFPDIPFRILQMPPLGDPGRAIWQCLGMVIGVYGVGYLVAARNPIRHWPIVLVGLLGKILGPIGFVWSASQGRIDWIFGLNILTNDLLWWVPFTLILLAARPRARGVVDPGTSSSTSSRSGGEP